MDFKRHEIPFATNSHAKRRAAKRLSVAQQGEGVAALPVLATGRTLDLVVAVALSDTTGLATSRSETTVFAVLHGRIADPVVARIATDGLVRGVDENDFEVLVGGVLVDPVGVQDAQVRALATDAFFSDATKAADGLELVNTVSSGLTHNLTLTDLLLATTTADTDAVNDNTLLSLVAQAASLIGAAGTRGTVDDVELAVFPSTNTHDEAHNVSLFLLVQFFNVLVSSHFLFQSNLKD